MHLPGVTDELRKEHAQITDVPADLDDRVARPDCLLADIQRMPLAVLAVIPVALVQIAVQPEAVAGEVMPNLNVSRQPLEHRQHETSQRLLLVKHQASFLGNQHLFREAEAAA